MTAPAVLTARLRTNGHCPPSLLAAEGTDLNDIFLQKVSNLVQDGINIGDNVTAEEFLDCMKVSGDRGR